MAASRNGGLMKTPLLIPCLFAVLTCAVAPVVIGQTRPAAQATDVGAYVTQLKSQDQMERLNAATAIGQMGPRGTAAVPALIDMLNSTESVERMAAAMALARIGPDAAPALPALRQMAANGDDKAKQVA